MWFDEIRTAVWLPGDGRSSLVAEDVTSPKGVRSGGVKSKDRARLANKDGWSELCCESSSTGYCCNVGRGDLVWCCTGWPDPGQMEALVTRGNAIRHS